MQRTRQLAEQYRSALLEDVIPFWLRHALDRDHGGIMTALDPEFERDFLKSRLCAEETT